MYRRVTSNSIAGPSVMARLFLAALVALPLAWAQNEVALPVDMGCTDGPRSANWGRVKQRFRSLFEGATGPFKPVSMEALTSAVRESVADVEAVRGLSGDADALNEC